MLFGKSINRYYLKYLHLFVIGLVALVTIDYAQLEIPKLYRYLINGINTGVVELGGQALPLNFDFVLDHICAPMMLIILSLVVGRFAWRICFFGAGIKLETDLRLRLFDHCKDLSQNYYQVNKVGNLITIAPRPILMSAKP